MMSSAHAFAEQKGDTEILFDPIADTETLRRMNERECLMIRYIHQSP